MLDFILCWRARRFWFVGPFHSSREAVSWAKNPLNNPGDNPCWQHIQLPSDALSTPPSVLTPAEASQRAAQDAGHYS